MGWQIKHLPELDTCKKNATFQTRLFQSELLLSKQSGNTKIASYGQSLFFPGFYFFAAFLHNSQLGFILF